MSSQMFKASAIALTVLLSSSLALATPAKKAGKGAHGKQAKECTDKGGVWEKKKKKCDLSKVEAVNKEQTDAQAPAPAAEESLNDPE
ncbi:MAG: hypothetical protein EOP07_09470 [Proteobacteria bacterium]|nr:MAG: hypothetical protein EOP07_09470 [Pseudomonadota bacterium]